MKFLDKIKNAIFEEEEEFDEEFVDGTTEPSKRELKKEAKKEKKDKKEKIKEKEIETPEEVEEEIVKQIDVEKTIPKKVEEPIIEEEPLVEEPIKPFPKREHRRTPVIFDENDFVEEEEEIIPQREIKKPEPKRTLYSGYRDERTKEKFKPSPNISPVYGLVGVSPVLEQPRKEEPVSKHVYVEPEKETISLDDVREKAYGHDMPLPPEPPAEEDDLGILYEMDKEDNPAIKKVTLGDAEEYFEDLGLEYNVDYKDEAKEKQDRKPAPKSSSTRSSKNEDLSRRVDEEIELEEKLESTRELEITKEQLKPRTAKEIKKVKKIEESDVDLDPDVEADEKNLYDLIDMMYDSK